MKKWLWRALATVLVFVVLVVVFYAAINYLGAKVWEETKWDLEQKGETLDFAKLVPPPVPDDQNFAATPLLAALFDYTTTKTSYSSLTTTIFRRQAEVDRLKAIKTRKGKLPSPKGGFWQKQESTDLVAWAQYFRKNKEFHHANTQAGDVETILAALEEYEPDLSELRKASLQPYSRFPVHYNDHSYFGFHLPHVGPAIGSTQVLSLLSSVFLATGSTQNALSDIRVIWSFEKGLSQEPFLISQLVTAALLQSGMQSVWEGLDKMQWSEPELAEIQSHYSQLDFIQSYEHALRGEIIFGTDTLDWIKTLSLPERQRVFKTIISFNMSTDDLSPGDLDFFWMPEGWIDLNKSSTVHFYLDDLLSSVSSSNHRVYLPHLKTIEDKLESPRLRDVLNPATLFLRLSGSSVSQPVLKSAQAQARVDQVVTACALERYKLKTKQYPTTLQALVPEFLAKVPTDVIDGLPLRYALDPANSRYRLFSIGWNETDDGGLVVMDKDNKTKIDEKQGDWVWAYPAKP